MRTLVEARALSRSVVEMKFATTVASQRKEDDSGLAADEPLVKRGNKRDTPVGSSSNDGGPEVVMIDDMPRDEVVQVTSER